MLAPVDRLVLPTNYKVDSSILITGSPEINYYSPNSFAVLSDLTGKDDVFLRSPLAALFNPPLFSMLTGDTSSFSNIRL